jgi:Xaa-Pro aminopeptidase
MAIFTKTEYAKRIKAAQKQLGSREALLVTKDANLNYFTGVDSGHLLVWRNGARFWLNPVYNSRAANSPLKPAEHKKDAVKEIVLSKRFKTVGVDDLSLAGYKSLDPKMRKLVRPSDLCEELRKIKSKEEIKLLTKAGRIASDVMCAIEESNIIGLTEAKLAAIIECELRVLGSEAPPFSSGMICASGPNSAYPHIPVSNRKIREGDLVILDMGAVCGGYHSDMTRTLMVGEVSDKKRDIVAFVDWLKEEAIERVKVGGKISEVHDFINKKIEERGWKFAHLSGHGVGLEVHERPSIGPSETDVFTEGMVFTIEPGVYLNGYGARSEDTIALIGKRKIILTD